MFKFSSLGDNFFVGQVKLLTWSGLFAIAEFANNFLLLFS